MTNKTILTALCLAGSTYAVKVQVKTEDFFGDIGNWLEGAGNDMGNWFEGAALDTGDWFEDAWHDSYDWVDQATWDAEYWLRDVFGTFPESETCYDMTTYHNINEAVPGRGLTSTYNWNLKMQDKSDDIEKDFYSLFGLDRRNNNRIS